MDDIIYNPANLKFGAIHRNKLKRGGVSPIYAIFSTEQLPAFMEYLVKRPSFIQESLKYLEGTVIKLMTLKPRDFLLMETYIPSIPEQEKIADLFTTLDSYIEIETKKTDSYKTLKASMLQKMFPQQGSLEPEIRFPGFTEPWEQRKLDDVLEVLKDGTHGTHADVDNGVYLLSAKNIKNGCVSIDESDRQISFEEYEKIHTKFKLKNGDVLMTIVGTIGEAAILESAENITFQRSVAFLRPSNELQNSFLLQTIYTKSFQKELDNRKATGAQPGIYLGEVAQIPIMIPTNLSEQEKISSYFDNLDNLITLHQRKCEQLQLLKHALQQKMFV